MLKTLKSLKKGSADALPLPYVPILSRMLCCIR